MSTTDDTGDAMVLVTYRIEVVAGRQAIRCLLCDRVSELRGDITNRYCGRCHLFHDVVAEARRYLRDGATHECGEWRSWMGRCAVCGHAVAADGRWLG